MDCGNSPIFSLTDEITVSAWVSISSIPHLWTSIVTKGNSAWRSSVYKDEPRFHFGVTGPPQWIWVDGVTRVNIGEWHHVCNTYDGRTVRVYLDGVLDSELSYKGGVTINTFPVWIGENAESTAEGPRGWDGLIDDVRVYTCALNEKEIKALYAGKGPGPVQQA